MVIFDVFVFQSVLGAFLIKDVCGIWERAQYIILKNMIYCVCF